MIYLNKILCKLGYHKYLYNHPSQPTRCECTRCGKKWKMVKNPKYIPNVTSPLEEPIYTWENFEDKINYKEIKSLGFEKAGFRFINKPHHKIDVTIFRKRKDSEFYYSLVVDNINHKIDISIQQFDSGYSKRLFYGKIENKKELETLMKQLEIISIEKGEPKR